MGLSIISCFYTYLYFSLFLHSYSIVCYHFVFSSPRLFILSLPRFQFVLVLQDFQIQFKYYLEVVVI